MQNASRALFHAFIIINILNISIYFKTQSIFFLFVGVYISVRMCASEFLCLQRRLFAILFYYCFLSIFGIKFNSIYCYRNWRWFRLKCTVFLLLFCYCCHRVCVCVFLFSFRCVARERTVEFSFWVHHTQVHFVFLDLFIALVITCFWPWLHY